MEEAGFVHKKASEHDMKYLLFMSQMENISSFYRELFQVKENTKLLIIHTYLCCGKQPGPCCSSKNTLLQALDYN